MHKVRKHDRRLRIFFTASDHLLTHPIIMNPRKLNTTSKAEKDRVEKETLFTKHCHALLVRLPFLKNETVKRMDLKKLIKKLEHHHLTIFKRAERRIHAPSTESASKIKARTKCGKKVVKKSNSKTQVSRKTRYSKQGDKRKPFVGPRRTQSNASKVKNDSIMELSRQKGRVPAKNGRMENTERSKNVELRACSVNFSNESINSERYSSKFRVRLTHDSYVLAFKRYLNVLGDEQKMEVLYQLAMGTISSEFFVKNASSKSALNKRLIDWIMGQVLEKDVLIIERDEIIESAIRKAEESVKIEFEMAEHENEMQGEQMDEHDENDLVNQHEVSKFSNAMVEGKVEAVKSMNETAFRSENLSIGKKVLAPDNKLFHSGVKEAIKADKMDILLEKYSPLVKSQNFFLSGEPSKVFITEANNTPKNMASVTKAKTCCFAALANRSCSCRSSGSKFIRSTAEENNSLSFITDSKPNEGCDNKITGEDDCRSFVEKCGMASCSKCKVPLITTKGVYYSFKPLERAVDPKISEAVRILRTNHISYLSRLKLGN